MYFLFNFPQYWGFRPTKTIRRKYLHSSLTNLNNFSPLKTVPYIVNIFSTKTFQSKNKVGATALCHLCLSLASSGWRPYMLWCSVIQFLLSFPLRFLPSYPHSATALGIRFSSVVSGITVLYYSFLFYSFYNLIL